MQKIKIIDLLQKISNSDIERLSELINSSNNLKPKIIPLYNEIIKNLQQPQKNTKENLWKMLFGKLAINDGLFRKLCFDLLQRVEQCISIIEMENSKHDSQLYLMQYYKNNNNEDFFEDRWQKTKAEIQCQSLISSKQLFNNYSLELMQYDFLTSNPLRSKKNNIIDTSNSLDEYYVLQKLKLLCHAINESKFTNYNMLPAFDEYIIRMAENKSLQKNTLISLYLDIYQLMKYEDTKDAFISVKRKLQTLDSIDESESRIIFQYLINYCIIELNKGRSIYEAELFIIYKTYVEKINDKTISPFRFKNIINVALKQKQFDFAAYFIDEFGKKLPSEHQQISIAFSKAKLQYEIKNYDTVISILQNVKNEDLTFNLSSKVLIVKTFYEKKEFQFLESFLESFRIFILRNKEMNTASKKIHQDFIKIIHRLIKMEFASAREIELFKSKINNNNNLPDKAWILEKLEAI